MSKELLPCPSCGHQPKCAAFLPKRNAVYCHNQKCDVWHRTKYFFTMAEAIAAWNKRFGKKNVFAMNSDEYIRRLREIVFANGGIPSDIDPFKNKEPT